MSNPSPPGPVADDGVADLVARCILTLESQGREAADRLLAVEPALADAARLQLEALERAGMLRELGGEELPRRIGPYAVRERLGRGGMGTVYLAEQVEPIRRRVALKVIRAGMDTREVLARFAVERQTLALLDHPNIAKVYDAGVTDDGRPFIAMEYVSGESITSYCNDRGLSTEDRLRLLADVCDTVQHAHQRGILHRDLKPSNVMVGDRDGRPWPMVIDFGVAKSTQHRLALETLYTEHGRMLGTPEYMSPEQAAHRVDVDTRTDVYSLGVLLYELLTGCLPIDSERLRRASQPELERILRDEAPPTPSTRISTLGEASTDVAIQRRTDPQTLRRHLRGDLDWVTMKALEKDRNRRYGMPADLAADLRRHLCDEPVLAGPPSAWYRFTKFAARHRLQVTAAAAVAGALIIGLVVSLVFYVEASARAREASDARGREAQARTLAEESLAKALSAADELLIQVGGKRLRRFPELAEERRALLQSGLAFCRSLSSREGSSSEHRLLVADAQLRVAWFHHELNQFEEAEQALNEAEELLEQLRAPLGGLGAWQASVVGLWMRRADVREARGNLTGAVEACRRALTGAEELARQFPDPEHEVLVAQCWGNYAGALRLCGGKEDEADRALAETVSVVRAIAARESSPLPELAKLLVHLGFRARDLAARSRPEEAQELLDELEGQIRHLLEAAPDDPDLLEALAPALMQIGRMHERAGRWDKAKPEFEKAIAVYTKLTERFPGYYHYMAALAEARSALGAAFTNTFRYRQALEEMRAAIDLTEQVVALAPDAPQHQRSLARALGNFGLVSVDYLRFRPDHSLAEAEALLDRAEALTTDLLESEPRDYGLCEMRAGQLFLRSQLADAAGDGDAALRSLRENVAFLEVMARDFSDRTRVQMFLSNTLKSVGTHELAAGNQAEAAAAFRRALVISDALLAAGAPYPVAEQRRRDIFFGLARALVAAGELAAAEVEVRHAIATGPDFVVVRRRAAEVLIACAESASAEAQPGWLGQALAEAEAAMAVLEQQNGGPGADTRPGYLITKAQVLALQADVHRRKGEMDRTGDRLADVVACWRKVLGLGDNDRNRGRLGAAYDALIAHLRETGAAAAADAAIAERSSVLGK